ncbi:MAG: hypothetical protein RM021_026505 [Nostoc sp. EkiNYC01]|nr:hypothetical protein [Nostoc sp. EkiNYC01]
MIDSKTTQDFISLLPLGMLTFTTG